MKKERQRDGDRQSRKTGASDSDDTLAAAQKSELQLEVCLERMINLIS